MSRAMLACGCASAGRVTLANGYDGPGCVIHRCYEVVPTPDLTGREARCHCGNTKPSNPDNLAFFVYCGPGSSDPHEFDRFYCGCRGWD